MNYLKLWIEKGQSEITDAAEYNQCLKQAIKDKDKKAILDLYESDGIDWDQEDDLADEMDTLIDLGNDIVFS